ncbi:alanine--tRNA ligase [Irregularibacter muris]|uniref:Alanine--tRNA ligase n=1 Tax=Irregularibacter muris TaxID=1796619 RepID=A0AAE3L3B2_9FIRM|nr:alanine--tRNA ligase [Irregularibacter muris]MCR1897948.1 alanine--tRNA ligase [Irregularibacter muris]
MQALGLNEIRERFLSFFEKKQHLRLPSAPLVPRNDNSLLLINSGMAPLKPYFIGEEKPPSKRVATCQKCIRTPDIERVGKTARHGTFFEMLGNFSFGDYFKDEATQWAWEFITKELEIPEDRLWVSIYENDEETFDIWTKKIGVSPDKIVRLGKEDNFWEIGLGPCGPCSELYYDRGEEAGCGQEDCAVGCDCDRFVEFWNLVFTQFDKDEEGNYNPLAHPNIDTGMGLERMAAIMQGVGSLFEVDTIRHVLDYVCSLGNIQYGQNDAVDMSIRVITDHIRSVTFMVGDGILPSNEGRGYVLRRLLRRAARHGKLLGIKEPFLYKVCQKVIEVSKDAYSELGEKQESIEKIISIEEARFQETIDQGLHLLKDLITQMKQEGIKVIPGAQAFRLYDTYGFPLDLTKEILEEEGMEVEEESFHEEMEGQRERARKARAESDIVSWKEDPFMHLDQNISTEFVGYSQLEVEGKILAIAKQEDLVDQVAKDDQVIILLDQTSFYAESGGQAGDRGIIQTETGIIRIADCKKGNGGKILHFGKVSEGTLEVGQIVKAKVNKGLRMDTARNHTTTHMLHKALREVLGEHVEQAGSLVTPDRLRFDFQHYEGVTQSQLEKIEARVNEIILESLPVEVLETDITTAKEMGATALFGEKYGEKVRVVKVGDFSIELCGGTHLSNSSQAGLFKITSEGGVAAGVRRIEALTGKGALKYYQDHETILIESAHRVKAKPDYLIDKIEGLLKELKDREKELEKLQAKMAGNIVDELINTKTEISDIPTIIARQDELDMDGLRKLGDQLKDRIGSGLIILATSKNDKVNFLAMATKDLLPKGIHAGKLIGQIAKVAGGGGGGRPDMAQAGGKEIDKIAEALEKSKDIILQQLEK